MPNLSVDTQNKLFDIVNKYLSGAKPKRLDTGAVAYKAIHSDINDYVELWRIVEDTYHYWTIEREGSSIIAKHTNRAEEWFLLIELFSLEYNSSGRFKVYYLSLKDVK